MEYPKIQTVFLRDPATKNRHLLEGQYALPEFEALASEQWEWTEKVDGTNIRLIWNPQAWKLEMRGRTARAQLPRPLLDLHAEMEGRFAAQVGPQAVVLFAEGFGPKIQSGGAYRDDHGLVAFDGWDPHSRLWMSQTELADVCRRLHLETVPVIGRGTLPEMVAKAREGFPSAWGTAQAEGIVARPPGDPKYDVRGDRVITKIKHKDFPR